MKHMKRKILLDCDPGHDDAIAILLAGSSPDLEILGISVVSGNQTVEKTARNAFNVSRYLGINVPIAIGASSPLKRERLNCGEIHGETGLDGFDFPSYQYEYDKRNATDFIIDTLLSNDKVTVVTTGPMTNIALAILKNNSILSHIDMIVVMGGSTTKGNMTPYAEFNILADAEAADICFNSGVPIRMMGLDVTRKVLVLPEVLERMKGINTKGSELFYKLMIFFNKTQKEVFDLPGGPLHDPATIVSLIDEKVFKYDKLHVEIDTSDTDHYGQTRCSKERTLNTEVALEVDVDRYWDIIERGLRSYE